MSDLSFNVSCIVELYIYMIRLIISNHGLSWGYSQIGVLSKFSDLWPVYWLGHTSVTSLDFDLRKWETTIDLRIGCRFENLKKGHRFGNWTTIWELEKKDIDLRYRCLWPSNRTWIWGLDVDLSFTYIYIYIYMCCLFNYY